MVDVRQVSLGHFGDIGATAYLHGDQPLCGENFKRFTQRRAADAIGFGNFELINPAARLQLTVENALTQEFSNIFVQCAMGERKCGHGANCKPEIIF